MIYLQIGEFDELNLYILVKGEVELILPIN